MNKIAIIAALLSCSAFAVGANDSSSAPEKQKLTTLERKARLDAMVEQKAGGFVVRPNSGKGSVTYVNCQKKAAKEWIEESMAYFSEVTKFKIDYSEGQFNLKNPVLKGNVSLYIIDDESLPPILVAPESKWALVNIAPIAKEQRPAFFEARTKKELSRAFAYLCGATSSRFERSLTRGIASQAELDKNPDYELPMDIVQRFWDYMKPLGVEPVQRATYLKACQDGWAPAPTNEVQKAIWNRLKEEKERGPANGLKIVP